MIDAYAPNTAGYVAPHMPGGLDVGAFVSDGGGYGNYFSDDYYFSSFALSPELLATEVHGKLSYENGATKTTAGKAINLGIARLYTDYAKGTLSGYDYSNNSNASALYDAIQLLLNGNASAQQWSSNQFLRYLSTMANSQAWLAEYNLDATYSLLDNNYAVYAMGIWWIDRDRWPETYPEVPYVASGDILYLVKRGGGSGSDVPEPATILLWALGGVGTLVLNRKIRK